MQYPLIDWNKDQLQDGLKALEIYAIQIGEQRKTYYRNNSKYKRIMAKALRIVAIFAGAIAGIIPIISQMTTRAEKFVIDPAWSTVAVTIAITAIGLDKFFGFSSGWIRFVTTQINIERKIEQLRLEIENEKFSWQGHPPTFEKAKATLAIIVKFLNDVSQIVSDETNTWVVEFQNVLQKFNDELNVKDEQSKTGALKVTIENGEKCNDGLVVHLEGHQPVSFFGSTYTFNNLFPKIYRVSVLGNYVEETVNGKIKKQLQDETLVHVTPGSLNDVTLQLK